MENILTNISVWGTKWGTKISRDVKMSKTEAILKRVDMFAKYTEGYFLAPFIYKDRKEKDLFKKFKERNSQLFDVVFDSRTKIFRANMSYGFRRKVEAIYPKRKPTGVVRRLIWAAFISDNDLDLQFPISPIQHNGVSYMIDDLSEDPQFKSGVVLTYDSKRAKAKGFHVPGSLQKKSFQKLLNEFLNGCGSQTIDEETSKEEENYDYIKDYVLKNFLEDGIWPEENQDLHSTYRRYPGLPDEVDGETKAEYDKQIIEKEKIVEGYKFGVYPI